MAIRKLKLSSFLKKQRYQQVTAIIVVVVIAVVGSYVLAGSHAATPYVATEAEKGTLSTTGATVFSDPTASGSSAVQFGATTTTSGFSWPSGVSSNKRYLVDQNGNPYLITGDSAWDMSTDLTPAEMATVFSARHADGFNVALVAVLTTPYIDGIGGASMTTYDGIAPFTQGDNYTNYNLADPNPAYFARIDTLVQTAAKYGITVMFDPAETGSLQGLLESNGTSVDYAYGQFLGNRYKNDPNIMWCNGNDFGNWTDPTADAAVQAVARGIESVVPASKQIQTVELYGVNNGPNSSLDDQSWGSIISLNQAYTYEDTYSIVITGYNQTPTMPVFMGESNYSGEDNTGANPGTDYELRQEEYGTMTSGATGQLYGDHCTYAIAIQNPSCGDDWAGWQAGLSDNSATQVNYMQKFFNAIAWYKLVPDQGHTFVTGGYGTYQTANNYPSTYVSSSLASDGSVGVAYLPYGTTITVNMAALSGPVTAQWYDPTTGTYTPIGTGLAHSGSKQFTSPAGHSDGNDDWVLLLQG